MSKYRMFQVVVLIAIVAFFVCGQQALAQPKLHGRVSVTALSKAHDAQGVQPADGTPPPVTPGIYGMGQAMMASSYPNLDSAGGELWPCVEGSGNADCSFLSIPGSVVLGVPQYAWTLAACNETTNGGIPCGLLMSWFEDDAQDTTDIQLETVTVTQVIGGVTSYIYDTGLQIFSPDDTADGGTGGLTPPANDVASYNDVGFGTLGQTGKNNGMCVANSNYPLSPTAPYSNYPIAGPGYFASIAAGKICKDPIPGLATVTAVTSLGTPTYTALSAAKCTAAGAPSPCYTVKFAIKHTLSQKWTIWLQ